MKRYSTQIDIQAPPETVWQILTDAAHYADWDPNMIKLEGRIAQGEQLTIYTKLAPERAFKPIVSQFDAPRKMVWQSGMPLGLFSGVRTFMLTPKTSGVSFEMSEEFSGLLLPVFGGTIPDMNPIFADFAQALKQRAEAMP